MVLKYRPILFCFALLYSASQILHFLQVEKCVSCSVVSNSLPSMDCGPPGSSIHGILQARILEWVAISFSRGIFPTQGLNLGLLHCRQILYHLSCQGSWSMATLHQIILSESLLPTAASHFKPLCHILIILTVHAVLSHARLPQSCPTLCTPWTVAHQAPLSVEFSRQEYWSGLLCPPPGDLPTQGWNLSLTFPIVADRFFTWVFSQYFKLFHFYCICYGNL